MIENVVNDGRLLAIIVRTDFIKEGVHFFTKDDDTMQLAYMKHPEGKIILPHIHNSVERTVYLTKEVLVVKAGVLRVDFYSNEQEYLKSALLNAGDIILLSDGGHGFKIIEDVEMYEIKQGPYLGELDKVRFEPNTINLKK